MEGEHTKSRRSSTILKPQKPRNPLSDLDFGNDDPQEGTTSFRTAKRVSFANSRNVRQFVADPEKNTIWDETYEEYINKSDNSGQFQMNNSSDDIIRDQLNTTQYCKDSSADLDFTDVVQTTFTNEAQVHKTETFNSMDLTQALLNVNATASTMKNQSIYFDTTSADLMDFTCESSKNMKNIANSNVCQNGNFNMDSRENTMEFTECIPLLNKENIKIQNSVEDIMDFTHAISTGCNMNKTEYTQELALEMFDTDKENVCSEQKRKTSNTNCLLTNTVNMDLTSSIVPLSVLIHNSTSNSVVPPEIENAKTDLAKIESKQLTYNKHISIVNDETFGKNAPTVELMNESNLNVPQKLINVNKIQTTNFNISELIANSESKQLMNRIVVALDPPQESLQKLDNMIANISERIKIADYTNSVYNCDESDTNYDITSSQTSSIKTHSSFHTDLTSDDTQHLINYPFVNEKRPKSNFSKIVDGDFNPSPMNSQFMILTDSIQVSLNMDENDQIKSSGNNSNMQEMNNEISKDLQVKLSCSEHAPAVNNRISNIFSICSNNENDIELTQNLLEATNISQEIINLCDTDRSMNLEEKLEEHIWNLKTTNPMNCHYLERIMIPDFSKVCIVDKYNEEKFHINKQYNKYLKELIDKKLDTFKSTYTKRNIEELINCDGNSADSEDRNHQTNETKLNDVKTESMKNRVKEHHNGCDGYWNILFLENGVYKFDTLFGTLLFTVHLDESSGIVSTVDVGVDHINASSETITLYIHRNFSERLSLKCIQSALGEKFHVLSLLDYVHMIMQKMIEMEQDFRNLSIIYSVAMDQNFRINFVVANANFNIVLNFSINTLELDNICDKTITYTTILGNIKDSCIKLCIVDSPKGFAFVRSFIDKVYQLLQRLETKKLKKYPISGKQ